MTPWAVSVLTLGMVAMLMPAATGARSQARAEEPHVGGYVLAPDGTPVSGGIVIARLGMTSSRGPIDSTGRFRLVVPRPGAYQCVVSVPGTAPFRFLMTVPASRSLRLPVLRLASGAYYRARFVTAGGDPIVAPQLHRRLFDASGRPIDDALDDSLSDPADNDGALTMGPLPRGILTLALDMPSFAQTRLPDVNLVDPTRNVDGGTIVIQQPGAVLNVDVVDGVGAPVPNHDVRIEDARPRSPLVFRPVRTNTLGRATFDRLAAGQYRVSTTAVDRCAGVLLGTSRIVRISANATIDAPLVIGGRVTFRITSPLGPAAGVVISASPDLPTPLPFPFRATQSECRGVTEADGRATLTNFPPGPAHVAVHMANSTYIRRLEAPLDGREVAIAIPDGFLPVRVIDTKNEPVRGANITWTGSGGRVEASAMVTGDALLEGVGTAGGALAVTAQGYQPAEEAFAEPPGILQTVALSPLPPPARMRARVITPSGDPLRDAVVEFLSTDPSAVPRMVPTDERGVVLFDNVRSGSVRLSVSADGFVTSSTRVATDTAGEVIFALARGYRAIADVALPETAGSQLVRVFNDSNQSMDDMLDGESDRRIEPPGRLSLGPLAPGGYVIELQGAGGRRQEHIRIVDRDVSAIIR